jgi:hypothetical protein
MPKAGILAGLVLAGALWAKDAEAPAAALARLRYYAGGGAEFIIRSPEGVKALLGWLAQVEKGPDSEHARTGACDRDAELGFTPPRPTPSRRGSSSCSPRASTC